MNRELSTVDYLIERIDSIPMSRRPESFPVLQLLGTTVLNEHDEKMGCVSDITMDMSKDEMLMLQLTLSNQTAENRTMEIPWSKFCFDYDFNCLRIAETLIQIPSTNKLSNADIGGGLYDNYRAIRFGNIWC